MTIIQKSQKALEYDKILTELAKFSKTEQSKLLCENLTPFVRFDDIETELTYTKEAKHILDFVNDIPVELTNEPEYLIRVSFDDVDNDVVIDEVGKEASTDDKTIIEKKYNMISREQAHEIAKTYYNHKDEINAVICQCEHGQSRSAAVAAAILEFRSRRGIDVFSNDNYYPNKVVYRRVLKALKDQIPVY